MAARNAKRGSWRSDAKIEDCEQSSEYNSRRPPPRYTWKPRWPPLTVRRAGRRNECVTNEPQRTSAGRLAISRRSHEKKRGCEKSNVRQCSYFELGRPVVIRIYMQTINLSLRTWFLQFLSPDGLHAKNVSLFLVCLLVLYSIAKVTRIAVR